MNILFFIPIPIAIVFDAFRQQRSDIAIKDSLREKEALFTCYTTMTKANGAEMNHNHWRALLDEVYKKKLTSDQINHIFMLLDTNKTSTLSINQFLVVGDLINGNPALVFRPKVFIPWDRAKELLNRTLFIKTIVENFWFEIAMLIVVLINSVALIWGMITSNEAHIELCAQVDNYVLYVYIFEFFLKIIAFGMYGYFNDNWNIFDFSLILMSLLTTLAFSMFKFAKNARTAKTSRVLRSTKIHRTLKMTKSIRSVRFMKVCKKFAQPFMRVKKLIHKIVLCIPGILQTSTILYIIMHVYAIIGMELFDTKTQVYNYGSPYDTSIVGFNDYFSAILQLFMLITENGWSNIGYD